VNPLVLVVDDEPDVEVLFRQQFRRDLRTDRFTMEFAQSAPMALQRIGDAGDRALILIPRLRGRAGSETPRVCWTRAGQHQITTATAYGLRWLPKRFPNNLADLSGPRMPSKLRKASRPRLQSLLAQFHSRQAFQASE
jgi:CheY-like chemotaxis protein